MLRKNILISYLICAPTGLFTVLFTFMLPAGLSGEGLSTIFIILTYGWAIVGLILSFLLSIWIGCRKAEKQLIKGKKRLNASFHFSFIVNAIIWSVFVIITTVVNLDSTILFYLILPIIAGFIFSVTGTTFTLGLIMAYLYKRNLMNKNLIPA